ncbi:MAG: FMN-binding protein [Verrucomicrobiaceae bacterium]
MPHLVRLYRLAVILGIAWLIQGWTPSPNKELPLHEFFPEAATLDPSTHEVSSSEGTHLGYLLSTLPETSHIRGYSGPADVAIALDTTGRVIGTELIHSPDTQDHLQSVIDHSAFWHAHHGLKLGSPGNPKIDAVSGSTLTSVAISRSIIERLGGQTTSRLFPTEILLAEFAALLPEAISMDDHPGWPGTVRLYDKSQNLIGHALRTAPQLEYLIGFQGPTDVLILLDEKAETVTGLRFRKSYDNEDYYERILDSSDYLQLYNGKSITQIITSDENIEGISGATDTSWAIAEGVKRRLTRFEQDRTPVPFELPWRNIALVLLTLGALLFSFTKLRGKTLARLLWQLTVVLILGLLFGDLLSQALFIGWAKHGLPLTESWGLILLAAAALLIPWSTGNSLYCHQLCPHGFLQQWLGKLPIKPVKVPKKLHKTLSHLPSALLILITFLALTTMAVNYADFEPFDAWLWRSAGLATILIAIIGLLASLFIPLAYCKYGCPTGALFKFLRHTSAGAKFQLRDKIAGGLLLFALFLRLS